MRWLAVVVLGACSFHNNDLGTPDGAIDIDAAGDGHVDPPHDGAPDARPDANNCFGGGLATVCLTALPTGDYDVPASATPTTVSTDSGCTQVVTQNGGPELCVIAGVNVHIDGTLDATGSRPLVLVATSTLEVSGKIDVASYRLLSGSTVIGEHVGAGEASGALCGAPTAGGNDGIGGAGGGAGGTFGGRGGAGAAGRNGAGGTAGASAPVGAAPTFVRGGCGGTSGGDTSRPGGGPGHGGGAVYLIAGSQIMASGVITASGQGGYGGDVGSGGGGGGGGGLIGLDAPTITGNATIFANGGAGGEGGGQTGYGYNGDSAVTATTAATCYDFNTNGGNGGAGSVTTTLDGSAGQTNDNGGGGGGGGAGVIRVFGAASLGGAVSPPAS
jgi:hypothetical protein